MKKIFVFFLLLLFNKVLQAQTPSADQNYIIETTLRTPGKTTESQLIGLPVAQANRSIKYFDGLGRPLQIVDWQATPTLRDLVTPIAYDAFGREEKKYLPYSGIVALSNGSYKPNALNEQAAFYTDPTNTSGWNAPGVTLIPGTAFSKTVFEASPLNRIQEQGFPGSTWQPVPGSSSGHTVKKDYGTNASDVKLWKINTNGASSTGNYLPAKLYRTTSKDENCVSGKTGTIDEYKDFEDHVVLKRIWENETKSLSTYYLYDDLGNLSYVLPPALNENGLNINSFAENDVNFNNYIYAYHYDGRQRLIEKKIPGKGWEEMVYDKLDRLVLSRDAVQAAANKWLFTKYDTLGRAIITGIMSSVGTRISWQTLFNAASKNCELRDSTNTNVTGTGYTNVALPAHANVLSYYTLNYYDDYAFYRNTFGGPTGTQSTGIAVKSLLTGSKVNILGTTTMLLTTNYYDSFGRVIQTKSTNHLGGTDVTDLAYNFPGQITSNTRTHTVGSTVTTIYTAYDYDHMGRKTKTYEKIGTLASPQVVLSELVYNEVGQVTTKKRNNGSNTNLLGYNERGWLNGSNSPGFIMALGYADGAIPQYNGNIANQFWSTAGGAVKGYVYAYDKLNRLTSGISSDNKNEQGVTYDLMGNILTLTRDALSPQVYTYTGNRLNAVTGGLTRTYTYDLNGNALTDGTNTFTYNVLNLPATVTGPNASTYTYDATGKKLTRVKGSVTTHYIDGIQYNGTAIDFIQTEEGIARPVSGVYNYEYTLKDHLGNARYSFNSAGIQIQADDYYPFGKTFNSYVLGARNNYLYNSKELQDGLEQYDYGARFYDPVIGRWNVVDPLAEMDRRTSPYAYGFDDPIRHTDPDGMFGEDFNEDEDGPGPRTMSLSKATQPTGSRAGNIFKNTLKASGAAIVIGLGPEDPIADLVAGGIFLGGASYALGTLIYDHLNGSSLSSAEANVSSKTEKEATTSEPKTENSGRAGKQQRLKDIANDDKESSANRGWVTQEKNQIDRGKRTGIRNPPGKELAHKRGKEAAKGYSYEHSNLQDKDLHRLQHKHDQNGRKNKENPN
ncbi:DUF6443 domain-containing protein [Pedobacter nutrimenti]|uniref:DUF6443 domain-containing protein n=1 Tax=Pedobacter nutrimenti TaxID=1241337 RepID=UPI0029309116|nr:DUF6443 domain-containing protein [Pedobacter nutrimenti]